MADPVVSIVIPTYNRAALLEEAIDSALAQTWDGDIEVIVSDNASTDHTADLVRRYGGRVRMLAWPSNIGMAGNIQRGISARRGRYFLTLHDDDRLRPTAIEELVAPFESEPNLVCTFGRHAVIDANGQEIPGEDVEFDRHFGRAGLPAGRVVNLPTAALVELALPPCGTLFDGQSFDPERLDPRAGGMADIHLLALASRTQLDGFYVGTTVYDYRVHGSNFGWTQQDAMRSASVFVSNFVLGDASLASVHGPMRSRLSRSLSEQALDSLARGDRSTSKPQASAAWRCSPSLRALIAVLCSRAGFLGVRTAQVVRRTRGA